MSGRIRVTVDVKRLYRALRFILGLDYIGPRELSVLLAIDRRAAGRILSIMANQGLASRWSRNYYRLRPRELEALEAIPGNGGPEGKA